ncbi:GLUG motif-containing protein [Cohnella herbarum]|uniref:SLH domain-containing protein n=1 Tax=Cohnella herbarum TaxID=2728023 RepID=A0A7Z2ZKV2_9BACL|nr:GLUG motif-containing protein [Cohnella herbarum]QJD83225.1 hypothetical protein HH215_08600 [Cohnella herbarum]
MFKVERKARIWLFAIMLLFGEVLGGGIGGGKAYAAGGDFAGGTGTSADPYLIGTANQLDKVRGEYLEAGTYFKVIADIDLSGYASWVSIGDSDFLFGGHFDGNDHTISGLTSRDLAGFGLFGLMDSGSWIGNLNLTDVSIIVPDSLAGGLAGANYQGTIENVSVTGEIEAGDYVGGLVGQNYEGTILNSNASVNVTGVRNIGGLVGDQVGTITDSYATGDVNGDRNVGGLIGYAEETEVRRSHASGDVVGTNEVGGLIGRIDEGVIEQSHASGNVTGNMDVGGLTGTQIKVTLSDSYATGDVYGTADGTSIGGLVGYNNDGKILSSYALGSVSGQADIDNMGGLAGVNSFVGIGGEIRDSYAAGDVDGGENGFYVGGLVGLNMENGLISNSFALGNINASQISGESGLYAGGLVGANTYGIIQDSYATGKVRGNYAIGGFIGENTNYLGGAIHRSFAVGDVEGGGLDNQIIGGFAGYNAWGNIYDSYASGKVSGGSFVGGLAGENGSGLIQKSYSKGEVTGSTDVGGLVGSGNFATFVNSFYDIDTSGHSTSIWGTGQNSSQMQSQSSYEADVPNAWDFVSVWGIDPGMNGGYPYLRSSLVELKYEDNGSNGGSAPASESYVPVTAAIVSGELDLVKTGYTFAGWNDKADGSGAAYVAGDNLKVKMDTTLYAQWNAISLSNDATLNSTIGTVSVGGTTSETITGVPYGTSLATIKAAITPAVGATFEVYEADGVTVATGLASGYKVIVTAQDGTTQVIYTVTVSAAPASTDATLTSTIGTVSTGGTASETITGVPHSTTLAVFKAAITPAVGATFEVYEADGVTVAATLASGYKVIVTAQNGTTQVTYTVTVNVAPPSTDATLTSTIGTVSTGGTVSETITGVPYGTTLAAFKAAITSAAGSTFVVYEADGVTVAAVLASGYKVIVTAQNGTTQVTYTVTVSAAPPNNDATMTSTIGTVSVGGTVSETITNVPYGTSLATIKAAITPAVGATFEVYEADGVTVATGLASGNKVIVTAQDGTTQVIYTVTVSAAPASTDATLTSTIGTVSTGGTVSETITNVPYGTSLATIKAAITPAVGATFEVYEADGVTVATGLASGHKVIVTAQNGTTQVTYTVTVNAAPPSTDATLTSTIGTVSTGGTVSETITGVPYGTTLATFKAAITPVVGATFEVYEADGVTVATGLASGYKVIVTAQNGTTQVTYTVTVNAASPSSTGNSGGAVGPATFINKLTLPAGKAGVLSFLDEITVTVPANATDKEVIITIDKLTEPLKLLSNQEVLLSAIFEVLKNFPDHFKNPVTVTIKYNSANLLEGQAPAIFSYDEIKKAWVEVADSKITGDRISVRVNSLAKYAVFAVQRPAEPTKENEPSTNFHDIAGHWAEANIVQALKAGIVSGYSDGSFKPNRIITRAEFAVMLMNALKRTDEGVELPFTDAVKIGDWAKKAVALAAQAGYINGYQDGTFRPGSAITRAEMAKIVANVLGLSQKAGSLTVFTDDQAIPSWAKGAIAAIQGKDIMKGKPSGQFDPAAEATRAEAVTVLLKLLDAKNE